MGPRQKVLRAREHLEGLDSEVSDWVASQGRVSGSVQRDSDGIHATFTFDESPDLRRWGLILGDFVHCLRSALDHLAYQLAITASGQNPPPNSDTVDFPIFQSRDRFYAEWRRSRRSRGAWVPRGAMQHLEALQPYPRRARPLLWDLHRLDIVDKHQIIQPVVTELGGIRISPGVTVLSRLGVEGLGVSVLGDDASGLVRAVRVSLLGGHIAMTDGQISGVGVNASLDIGIRVTDGVRRLLSASSDLFNETVTVVDRLAPFI